MRKNLTTVLKLHEKMSACDANTCTSVHHVEYMHASAVSVMSIPRALALYLQ